MANGQAATNGKTTKLNVIFHGSMTFAPGSDDSIKVLIPEMYEKTKHTCMAGTWDDTLEVWKPGVYTLRGVKNGSGKTPFTDNVIAMDSTTVIEDRYATHTLILPPPDRVSDCNFVQRDGPSWFATPKPATVTDPCKIALVHVLTYDVDKPDELYLETAGGTRFDWAPKAVAYPATGGAWVNLHIFSDPHSFAPRPTPGPPETAAASGPPKTAWSALMRLTGDKIPDMVPGSGSMNIDPGDPIPGLPVPQQGSLSVLLSVTKKGELTAVTSPYDCGPNYKKP